MTLYVVTDISNAARYLSFGCLGPVTLHDEKYRPDASEQHGGALVLFKDARHGVESCQNSGGVLTVIELDGSALIGLPSEGDIALTGSLVPAHSVRRLHFRNESDRLEFRTLEYQNLDPSAVEQAVSADLFQPSGRSVSRASGPERGPEQAALDIDAAPAEVSPVQILAKSRIASIDRSVGALGAIMRPVHPSRSALKTVGKIVSALLSIDDGHDAVVGGLLAKSDETALHEDICSVLREAPHDDVGHSGILKRIGERQAGLAESLAVVEGMVDSTREFALREIRSRCLQALLMALAARTPAKLRTLQFEPLPEQDLVLTLALWYAGLREGGARRPVVDRLGEFERLVQSWAARQGVAGNPLTTAKIVFKGRVRAEVGESHFEYFLEDDAVRIGPIIRGFPRTADRLSELVRLNNRVAVWSADRLGIPSVTTIRFADEARVVVKASEMRIESPHTVNRETDPEAVVEALELAPPEVIEELGARYLQKPSEAP